MTARPLPYPAAPSLFARFRKAWAALSAGVAVVLGSGLLTGDEKVWIATAVAAVSAAVAVAAAPRNADPVDDPPA